jgi:hypothetical protein
MAHSRGKEGVEQVHQSLKQSVKREVNRRL